MIKLKALTKHFDFNIIGIYFLLATIYYTFNLSLDSLLGLIFGSLITFIFFVQIPDLKDKLREVILAITAGITAFLFYQQILFLSGIIFGLNLTIFYLHYIYKAKSDTLEPKYSIDLTNVNMFNCILILGVVLTSAIEKFRGFNKLSLLDIKLIVPLVIISVLSYFILILVLKTINKIKQDSKDLKFLLVSILILGNIFFLISYFTFKEVGNYLILGPLLAGLIVYASEVIKLNYKIEIVNIFIFIFLISYPYQITGLLGISIAFLTSILLTKFLVKKDSWNDMLVNQLFYLVFIYASTEYLENKGLIPKFNLVNGMQIVFIFISASLIINLNSTVEKIKNLLANNEIISAFGFLITLFVIILAQIGLKYAGTDLLIGFIVTGTISLVILKSLKDSGKLANLQNLEEIINSQNLSYLLNLVGAILLTISVRL